MRIRLRRRNGLSVFEAIILMIVLLLAIGGIASTVVYSNRTLSFSRQDRDSREVLFNWVQTFESNWPPSKEEMGTDKPWENESALLAKVRERIETVGGALGEWKNGAAIAIINGFNVQVEPEDRIEAGSIVLKFTIYGENVSSPYVKDLERSYNIYTTDTVSDDSYSQGGV